MGAVVTAKIIQDVAELTLNDGQTIVTPADAEFKNNSVYVGNALAKNILIQPADYTGINEIRNEEFSGLRPRNPNLLRPLRPPY